MVCSASNVRVADRQRANKQTCTGDRKFDSDLKVDIEAAVAIIFVLYIENAEASDLKSLSQWGIEASWSEIKAITLIAPVYDEIVVGESKIAQVASKRIEARLGHRSSSDRRC